MNADYDILGVVAESLAGVGRPTRSVMAERQVAALKAAGFEVVPTQIAEWGRTIEASFREAARIEEELNR